MKKLQTLAKKYDVLIRELPNGHFQIIGRHFTVNYYPYSTNRTAYVNNTKKGHANVSPERAVFMALDPPKIQREKVQRRNYRYYKKQVDRLFKQSNYCFWCRKPMLRHEASLEHIIPLKRGGLDEPSNYAIAHKDCNAWRGHDMPETKWTNKTEANNDDQSPTIRPDNCQDNDSR
jgi:hypothetical protein